MTHFTRIFCFSITGLSLRKRGIPLNHKKDSKLPNPTNVKRLTRLGELISDGLITLVKWNFLFILTSLPVITIGPSLGALSYCANALVKDDLPQENAAKLYFSAFRTCFRSAFPLGFLILLVNLLFGGGFFFYLSMMQKNPLYIPFVSTSALILLFFWSILTHLLPMLFNIEETDWISKQVFLAEIPLCDLWKHAVYKTLLSMPETMIAMGFSVLFLGGQFLIFPTTLPFTIMIGFSFPAIAGALSHTEPEV